jgi:dTDP-4-dehydrorhamnose 3,5-epimerase
MALSIEKTKIEGLVIIHPHLFEDKRGFFLKDFEQSFYKENGLPYDFYEISESKSQKGAIRGLHFQQKYAQGVYMRVIKGSIYVVGVDLRFGSPTFGQWQGIELTEQNHTVFYIPEGFAHGSLALEDDSIILNKCTNRYAPEHESGIRFDDPEIGVKWPYDRIGGRDQIITTPKDINLQSFRKFAERKQPITFE